MIEMLDISRRYSECYGAHGWCSLPCCDGNSVFVLYCKFIGYSNSPTIGTKP